jgi:putative transposase
MSYDNPSVSITQLSELFGISRQAWYQAIARQEQVDYEQGIILWEVKQIRKLMPRIGTDKLHHLLTERGIYKQWGIKIGRDKLNALLSLHQLQSKRRTKRAKTTDSNHHFRKYDDLLKQNNVKEQIQQSNKLWVSDITYIPTGIGFSYLSLITDAYSRKIVGWHLSPNLSAKDCTLALHKAIQQAKRKNENVEFSQLIHHSDRGVQYCSNEYVKILKQEKIRISMTQSGDPYDNALAERMNRIIKEEFLENKSFFNYNQAYQAVEKAITIYNSQYPHGSLGFCNPNSVHVMPKEKSNNLTKKWYKKKIRTLSKDDKQEMIAQ